MNPTFSACLEGRQVTGDSKMSLEPGRASLLSPQLFVFRLVRFAPFCTPKYPDLRWVTTSDASFCHSQGSRWGSVVTNMEFGAFLPCFSILQAAPSPAAQALEGRGDFPAPVSQVGHSRHRMSDQGGQSGTGLDPLCLQMLLSTRGFYGWLCLWNFSLGRPRAVFNPWMEPLVWVRNAQPLH